MSPFAKLLEEARDRLRIRYRKDVGLHFDWDGTDGPASWFAWWSAPASELPRVFRGCAGEEALRRLVDDLRKVDS